MVAMDTRLPSKKQPQIWVESSTQRGGEGRVRGRGGRERGGERGGGREGGGERGGGREGAEDGLNPQP